MKRAKTIKQIGGVHYTTKINIPEGAKELPKLDLMQGMDTARKWYSKTVTIDGVEYRASRWVAPTGEVSYDTRDLFIDKISLCTELLTAQRGEIKFFSHPTNSEDHLVMSIGSSVVEFKEGTCCTFDPADTYSLYGYQQHTEHGWEGEQLLALMEYDMIAHENDIDYEISVDFLKISAILEKEFKFKLNKPKVKAQFLILKHKF